MGVGRDWCILTCSKPLTLPLVASLSEAGFSAWAPVTREVIRTDDDRTREEKAVPLLAGYVFAAAEQMADLVALSRSPTLSYQAWNPEKRRMVTKGHGYFRVFRYGPDYRTIPDHELEPLRRLERKPRAKRVERTFSVGDRVRTDDAGFQGLVGTVLLVMRRKVKVSFGKWLEPEMPTWALRPIDEPDGVNVNAAQSERDAAKAA